MNKIFLEIKSGIKSNLLISSMLFFQLTLCFILCAFSFVSTYNLIQQTNKFSSNYGDKQYLRVWDAFYDEADETFKSEPNYIGKMKSVYNKMCDNKIVNFFSEYNNPVYIENAPDNYLFSYSCNSESDFSLKDSEVELSGYDNKNHMYNDVKCIWLDKKGLDYCNLTTEEDRKFDTNDFKFTEDGDTVSIIMGADYKKYYKIGETFNADILYANVKFKIVGFLAEDEAAYTVVDGNSTLEKLNNYIILPLCDCPDEINEKDSEKLYNLLEFKICGYSITQKTPNDVQNEITKICNEVGFSPVLQVAKSTNYESSELMMDIDSLSDAMMTISLILLIFSTLTLTLFVVNNLRRNLKYYAILLTNGYTFLEIIFVIIGIPIIINMSAFILSVLTLLFICNTDYINVLIFSMLSLLILSLIIISITAVFVFKELKKHDLAQYLRQR